jgi:membrane-bound serine protease (ClpP class)
LGIIFIGMEVFVMPGFGIAGVGGLALTLGSLVMASQRFLVPGSMEELGDMGWDVMTVFGAFVGFLIALLFLANYIGDIPGLRRLTLKPQVASAVPTGGDAVVGEAYADPDTAALLPGWQRVSVGDVGTASGALRPGGKMAIEDFTVDVVTEGDFVEHGHSIKVIAKRGTRVVVRPM